MSGHILWAVFAVLLLGIFIGSNLGIMLMCLLQVAKKADHISEKLTSIPVEHDDIDR
jgi:hypothetical protein